MTFGTVSFGYALGEPVDIGVAVRELSDDVERILGYGYRTVHRAADGEGVTDLGVRAAQEALAKAGIAADEIDLIVFAPTDVPEYLYWDPSASLQWRLGARRAQALLLNQACTAGLAGLDIIAGRFATQPDCRTALLVAGNRTCEAYWNRVATQSMVFSDGAAAAVVRRDHPRLRWLASDAVTDGRYADFYLLDVGGTAQPFTPARAGQGQPVARDAWDIMEFFDYDDERFAEFVTLINTRALDIVNRACKRVGATASDLKRLITSHDNVRSTTSLAETFGLPVTATNVEIGAATGHLGSADQLYSLGTLVEAGELAPGDLVALVGLGRGMHWACTIIET